MGIAKPFTEFIGTFALVFTIGMCFMEPGAGAMAPVAVAGVLMAMIYAGGHVSGAHYNPAATLTFVVRGAFDKRDVPVYVVAQLAAGGLASLAAMLMKGERVSAPMEIDLLPAFVAEALFTFALCYVILNVATVRSVAGNSYYGLAIAGVVLGGIYAVVDISGASFNPAVTLALGIVGFVQWSDLWALLAGELLGAVGAALVFRSTIDGS